MRVEQLTTGESTLVEGRFTMQGNPRWLSAGPDGVTQLEVRATVQDDRLLVHHPLEPSIEVSVTDRELALFDVPGQVTVVWVSYVKKDEPKVGLQLHLFEDRYLPGPLEVVVDDAVADRARIALNLRHADFGPVAAWLQDEFALPPLTPGAPGRIVHTGGPTGTDTGPIRSFRLRGRRWVATVTERDGQLRITAMTDSANRSEARWPRLSAVDLRFVDQTSTTVASEALRAALAGLDSDRTSYLELWEEYNAIERSALVEEAHRLGWARYRGCVILADGAWRFDLAEGKQEDRFLRNLGTRPGRVELEASATLPSELSGDRGRTPAGEHGTLRHISMSDRTLVLEIEREREPAPTGYLHLSLSGDRVRLARRDEARDRIATDQTEMPGLRLLIEGIPISFRRPDRRRSQQRVLDSTVRAVFGGNDPTETQLAALRMAMDTPDVLLVQGPPGTGKTQFITALLAGLDRLAEDEATGNRTLVSSFQHTAVNNVAGRARHRGLPPNRVSPRREVNVANIREWRDEVVAQVDAYVTEHRPEVAAHDLVGQVRRLASAYHSAPTSDSDLADLLGRLYDLTKEVLPPRLLSMLSRTKSAVRARVEQAGSVSEAERTRVTALVRALRVTETAFDDDGPATATALLTGLADVDLLTSADRALLETAGSAADAAAAPLADMGELRGRLLVALLPGTAIGRAANQDPEVEELLMEVADAVEAAKELSADGVDEVLLAYRDNLRQDLALVERTLSHYNSVVAATVQQVKSDEMSRVLDMPLPSFDTVIVDEAARANPLDLMIPLSCASRRIILVGDHKQLPHSLEQAVERELRRGGSLEGSELKKSLFERWFDIFSAERPTVRTIRLDTQFRMHPALGRFVSGTFYGRPDAISSHPSTERLTQRLGPYAGKVAAWIDVPLADGAERRSGTSRVREVEAVRLVRELRDLAALDTAQELTFGVISFYRDQQLLIEDALVDAGLGVRGEDDRFAPVQTMAFTSGARPKPRLLVGTVDAFQGMEFDVVLLSVTRSSAPATDPDDPREAVRRYGHLISDSRMCVAMSRQRRLLVAVGDAEMARRGAMPTVPGSTLDGGPRSIAEGIVGFLELCEGEDGAGVRP